MFSSTKLSHALLGLAFLCLSCFNPFAPKLDDQPDLSNVITDQLSPEETLQNFRIAYTFKDSLLYSEVLSESFVFEFLDNNLEPVNWGRDVDLRATGRLFRQFDVVDLHLDILFPETQNEFELRFVRFNLNLVSESDNFIATGIAVFTFEQDATDKKWRIRRWKDESTR